MSTQGSPYARFRRALDSGDLFNIRIAASELPRVPLDDALRICLLLRTAEPDAYDRAVLRWLGRFCFERPEATLYDVRQAAELLAALPSDPETAAAKLTALAKPPI